MPVYEVSVAAATAVLGYDLLTNRRDAAFSSVPRVITGIALTGSAAADDTVVELKVGNTLVAVLRNITTGNPTNDHIQPLNAGVPIGAPIQLTVTDAPATNPIIVRLIVEDLR